MKLTDALVSYEVLPIPANAKLQVLREHVARCRELGSNCVNDDWISRIFPHHAVWNDVFAALARYGVPERHFYSDPVFTTVVSGVEVPDMCICLDDVRSRRVDHLPAYGPGMANRQTVIRSGMDDGLWIRVRMDAQLELLVSCIHGALGAK